MGFWCPWTQRDCERPCVGAVCLAWEEVSHRGSVDPMATFQCQQCGNLHGAPVETCGMCGSPAVMLVPDGTQAPAQPGPPPPPAGAATDAPGDEGKPDAFAAVLGPLFEQGLAYVKERDAERAQRHDKLDELENARRDRVAHAKVDLLGQVQTLVDKLTELVESGVTYVDTVLLVKKTPVVE